MKKLIIGVAATALAVLALPAPALAQAGGDPNTQVDYPGDPNAPDAGTRAAPDDATAPDGQYDDEDGQYAPGDQGQYEDDDALLQAKPGAEADPGDQAYPDDDQMAPDDLLDPDDEGPDDVPYYGDKPDPGASLPPKMNAD